MRFVRFLVLAMMLLAATSLVWADNLGDPQMIVDPIIGPAPFSCTDPVTSSSVPAQFVTSPFSFSSTGQGFYCFVRFDSGPNWLTLDINLTGLSLQFTSGQINCATDGFYYDSCTKQTNGSGFVTDLLYTAGTRPGIATGSIFGIDIRPPNSGPASCDTENESNGPFCWGSGDFTATGLTSEVPEPASAILLISGVGALVGKRRWLKRS